MRSSSGRAGGPYLPRRQPRFDAVSALIAGSCIALGFTVLAGIALWDAFPPQAARPQTAKLEVIEQSRQPAPKMLPGVLLDPRLTLGTSQSIGDSRPLASSLARAPETPAATEKTQASLIAPTDAEPPTLPLPALPETSRALPLPVPRPSDLIAPPVRVAEAEKPRRVRPSSRRVAAAPAVDDRNFIERLFGITREPTTALAYAAPQDEVVDAGRGRRLSPLSMPALTTAARTAIYDIEAKTVYMPNGERLEAHSGLGDKMDDPSYVHVRMHGATPPHVYELTERESLFHGHRAVRLHPVGGARAIFGRAGLLAHPYLLGPRGDSNGCVSILDYQRFLQAFLRGEVKRLVVVARRA